MAITIDELIAALTEAREQNGNLTVNVCTDGVIYEVIELNCVGDFLYIEGYDA